MAHKDGDRKSIHITVNNSTVESDIDELTGAQVKTLAKVPADYELFQVKGQHTVAIGNEELIRLHSKEQFRAIPAGTFGRNVAATQA